MKAFGYVFFLLILGATQVGAQSPTNLPLWDHTLPLEDRVNDVINRLTLEEKVAQMLNAAPAIPRLGIPAYDWWNEVLHGVARTPFPVTVFPQAIGMAATWDTVSLRQMARFSAVEGRAIYNQARQLGRDHPQYQGLTYWTPNINIFRDPRWGRGQETYGEDPFLTGMLGRAFVQGLQGEDPHYLIAAACAKHFAVHSGPEPSRHEDDIHPSAYDLWDTYLPAFRELVTQAHVAGVMCAYNAIRGQPCCASDPLMNDILRVQWQFKGYVTSDCWAISDFYDFHKTHPDATSAAVDALIHGTDVECGRTVYATLVDAVRQGLITEAQIDVSLRRLFTIRFRLGMFDPPELVPYGQTPITALEAPEHQAHALKMARQSMVLLKNAGQTLPLKKDLSRIAVIGPNADNPLAVLGNYNGVPTRIVTPLVGIQEKVGDQVDILYERGVSFTDDTLLVYQDIQQQVQWNGQPGIQAEYFDNPDLKGTPALVRREPRIDHLWVEGAPVGGSLTANQFSARYSMQFTATEEGPFTFEVEADDDFRFSIDGREVMNTWKQSSLGPKTHTLVLRQGQTCQLVLEYRQTDRQAMIRLRAGKRTPTDFTALVQRVQAADAIIFVGGISPQLEGEDMRVSNPGFLGGDRTSILLPAVQTRLLQALKATEKPVILVLMTGSAIAMPWEAANLPAIINAWYGGQATGTALADILFGDYNPAGRLPVTFYQGDADLPAFKDYDMSRRTYRYFQGQPLYPFGFGLSYSSFTYRKLKVPSRLEVGQSLTVRAQVTNTGAYAGEEVVQLYLAYPNRPFRTPIRALKGFQRIALAPGETKTVTLTLTPDQLAVINAEGEGFQPTGQLVISLGGGQPGVALPRTSTVVSKTIVVRE